MAQCVETEESPRLTLFMQLRRLGRTNIQVSAVGFGTCQLRMVPESQAIDTLLRGFDLGVNIIHTAPDYEGAEDLVAAAVARTDRKVIVCSQAYDAITTRPDRCSISRISLRRPANGCAPTDWRCSVSPASTTVRLTR